MHCLSDAIGQTIKHAYAHHIQRLMVTGNFALLAQIHPDQVNEWYMIVYADAYEWVELPNVTGMALFADGGVFASKPYAGSGKYINRMSNYCKSWLEKRISLRAEVSCFPVTGGEPGCSWYGFTSGNFPSKLGSSRRIRSRKGGWVEKLMKELSRRAFPKNIWLISSAFLD